MLKSFTLVTNRFSIDSMESAHKRSCFIEFLRKVLMHFNEEKQRSGSDVVIGMVTIILSSVVTSPKAYSKLFFINS